MFLLSVVCSGVQVRIRLVVNMEGTRHKHRRQKNNTTKTEYIAELGIEQKCESRSLGKIFEKHIGII